jgi:hypothetical protein
MINSKKETRSVFVHLNMSQTGTGRLSTGRQLMKLC